MDKVTPELPMDRVCSPPLAKRLMRSVWSVLPRGALSHNLGKLITRTLLRPAAAPQPVAARFGGEIPMVLDLSSFVANDLYCLDDHYEAVTLRLWRQLARDARTILDVGSHIGTFALIAAAANPRARVLAVEAHAGHFARLQRHCERYPNITPVHAAIADRATTMWFCVDRRNDGIAYLSPAQRDDADCYTVESCTLTELCEANDVTDVDLMKLDVEGLEHELLVEDSAFWRWHAPAHLLVELTMDKLDRGRSAALFGVLAHRGYKAQRLEGLYLWPWGKPKELANWYFTRCPATP